MSLPSTARVVVVGGGVVGVSTLYHLAKAGWAERVLLEKNELTAGSTWHAADNCPNFSTSFSVMNMQRYGLELYRGLAREADYPINYFVTSAIRLAHSQERTMEFQRVLAMAAQMGMTMDMCTPDEVRRHFPFMATHELEGGLWEPLDGDWIVETGKGNIRCEYFVDAAGYYAARVGDWFPPYGGRKVPMAVMAHQYFLTEEIPEGKAWTHAHGRKLPMLREDGHSLNLGPYERNCRPAWVAADEPMPEDFGFQLHPDDLDRLEWQFEDAMSRVPILGTRGVKRNINGPIPMRPTDCP